MVISKQNESRLQMKLNKLNLKLFDEESIVKIFQSKIGHWLNAKSFTLDF